MPPQKIKKIMAIKYILKLNTNNTSTGYNKLYARAIHEETVSLDQLAEHMSQHNTPYSKGAIKGVLTDMVLCIKELLLDSKKVKLDDLAIFSLGLQSKPADSEDDWDASKIVKARIRALGTGEFCKKQLDMDVRGTPIGSWLPVKTTGLVRLSIIKLMAEAEYDIVSVPWGRSDP